MRAAHFNPPKSCGEIHSPDYLIHFLCFFLSTEQSLQNVESLAFISTGNYKKLILSEIKEVFLQVCSVRSSH